MRVSNFFCIFAFSMYRIRRLLVWLRRSRYSRGFGVQSPFAYRFVRYVVNEHYPYYAYEQLSEQMPDIGKKAHKLGRLYFRIANWKQPDVALNCSSELDMFRSYMTAGCRAVRVIDADMQSSVKDMDELLDSLSNQVSVVRIAPEGNYERVCQQLLDRIHENGVLIVEQIRKNKAMHHFWRSICAHERVTVTFDLYYCGVILFEKKHYKQNYKINF